VVNVGNNNTNKVFSYFIRGMEELRGQFKEIIIPIAPSVLYDIQINTILKNKSNYKSINPFIPKKQTSNSNLKIKVTSPIAQ
jgi:hypothetical protein